MNKYTLPNIQVLRNTPFLQYLVQKCKEIQSEVTTGVFQQLIWNAIIPRGLPVWELVQLFIKLGHSEGRADLVLKLVRSKARSNILEYCIHIL